MYSIGDKVVYPMHGAGVIVDIEKKEILGEIRNYYILKMPIQEMKVMVPVEQAEEIGVRPIYGKEEMKEVLETLQSDKKLDMPSNWNRRFRFSTEKIKTGDIVEIAKVVRCLVRMDNEKNLSTGERKLLNNAKKIIVSEMALIYEKTAEEAEEIIDEAILG
ncbi:CarD family transcriptional regulator [uncultured Peptoniphilus sp.]|uniref:CarD family transcriptional regulator n=1 Tax=uncultured Peptoniphilus sp. TaxID=254354 RepID=UPI0028053DA3|nr:CarD family transcriptional regulator [uncultured Peptoniphilus sp.]